jgi:hypothetical protein
MAQRIDYVPTQPVRGMSHRRYGAHFAARQGKRAGAQEQEAGGLRCRCQRFEIEGRKGARSEAVDDGESHGCGAAADERAAENLVTRTAE